MTLNGGTRKQLWFWGLTQAPLQTRWRCAVSPELRRNAVSVWIGRTLKRPHWGALGPV